MAHFYIDSNDDGSVRRILRDGELHAEGVSLEQLFSIVTLYFKLAASNILLLERGEKAATTLILRASLRDELSGDFIGTKRMVGRVTASQIASASAASFFCRFR